MINIVNLSETVFTAIEETSTGEANVTLAIYSKSDEKLGRSYENNASMAGMHIGFSSSNAFISAFEKIY